MALNSRPDGEANRIALRPLQESQDDHRPPTSTVALVIPVHNESAHIIDVLASIPDWIDRVFVIDDASTDDTRVRVATCEDPRVNLVAHSTNKGVGAAMRTGYELALSEGYDLIGKMDGDGQMCPDELMRLARPCVDGLADYAKGNRFYFQNAAADMPKHRSFGNTTLSLMTKLASGYWHVYDSQCGYTMIRAQYLRLIRLEELADDYFFENCMLIMLNELNARVVDVPVSTIYGDETSGISVLRVIRTFPLRLMSGGVRRFWRKHLVTDFGAVGVLVSLALTLSLLGFLFGSYHWWLSASTGQVASTGTVMIATLPIIISIQLAAQAFVLSVLSSPGARETAEYVRTLIAEGGV